MKKICILILAALISTASMAQTAKSVLDKAAANITVKEGVKANFKMMGGIGNASGTILIKGNKFHATTHKAIVWFDGKTMWTYMKANEEVNVSNPSEAQLQSINPYNFINLYKNGYASTLNTTGNAYVVHLTSTTNDKKIKELFITIDKQSYHPTKVKLLQGKSWTEFEISDLSKTKLADSEFRFNAKDFPKAEVIDLR
jgi:outer membrane lipoprotein-sorting protein